MKTKAGSDRMREDTRCVKAGEANRTAFNSITVPIVQNAAFEYPDVDEWIEVALYRKPGDIYSRTTNPTVRAFEEKAAALEGAEDATACSSGMAAINNTLMCLLRPGDVAVSLKDSYGATYLHFTEILPSFGIQTTICETTDYDAIDRAVSAGCKLVYLESPTNPTLKIVDIARVAAAAKRVGAITVVDNTFATPINQKPLALGADIVIHSASKYLGGHSDVIGGVVCGTKEWVWKIFLWRNLTGACLDPHAAYLLIRGMKTLHLRVAQQNRVAMRIAQFLQQHPKVTVVNYPGLPSHPNHDVAARQMRGFGGVLSFALQGQFDALRRFLPLLKYIHKAANLGQVDSIAGPPATTSHVECTVQERAAAGIPETLIRLSVGVEDSDDLIEDLGYALDNYDR
ncbi:MAG: cystathionine gamma-synthase [Anaerolineae bacterium SM23_84]|nr:MAG: cystathionine gamma-synthase [Anaerolineae bacterium SM23_84]